MNNLAPMKNCPGGVQGNLNWMPGYRDSYKSLNLEFLNCYCLICTVADPEGVQGVSLNPLSVPCF